MVVLNGPSHGGGHTLRQRWRDAVRDAVNDPALDLKGLSVAMAYDRHMSADGTTNSGERLIAELARVSKGTAGNRTMRLIDAGWLELVEARRGRRSAVHRAAIPTVVAPSPGLGTNAATVVPNSETVVPKAAEFVPNGIPPGQGKRLTPRNHDPVTINPKGKPRGDRPDANGSLPGLEPRPSASPTATPTPRADR
jgi:hypothetical protein